MLGTKPYNEYITEDCLDAIRVIDGPGYGLRPRDIDKIRGLKTSNHMDIPSAITNGNIKSMTEEQKRDAAGYLAVANTFDLDRAYGIDGDYFFKAMEQFDRSAIMTLMHHTGTEPWIAQYNSGAANSLLAAAKSGIREDLVMSLISNPDGSLAQWPSDKVKRNLVAVKLMYDIENDSFADKETSEKTFNRWEGNSELLEDIRGCIKAIAEGDKANAQAFDEQANIDDAAVLDTMPQEVAAAEKVMPAKSGLSKLTEPIKKLFTNKEETANAAQGNQNINLQQSASPAGRGANQQLR